MRNSNLGGRGGQMNVGRHSNRMDAEHLGESNSTGQDGHEKNDTRHNSEVVGQSPTLLKQIVINARSNDPLRAVKKKKRFGENSAKNELHINREASNNRQSQVLTSQGFSATKKQPSKLT